VLRQVGDAPHKRATAGSAARRPPACRLRPSDRPLEGTGMTQPGQPVQHHPVVVAHRERRAADVQLRIADAITAFAGSMRFVYIHAVVFAVWMLFVETNPWPTLTLVVSLEAIFLSTFVMIGQNRQASFQQAKADHDFLEQELELKTNTELTRAVHTLTKEIHSQLIPEAGRR
jgi:uncharacterized membrane protein